MTAKRKATNGSPDKMQARIIEIEQWILKHSPEILNNQAHYEDGTEKAYYMFGYMMALKDVVEVLERMGIQWNLK